MTCEMAGCQGSVRQVPKAKLRVLKGCIPASLAQLNLTLIQRENPRYPKPRVLRRAEEPQKAVSWKDLTEAAVDHGLKRSRRSEEKPSQEEKGIESGYTAAVEGHG